MLELADVREEISSLNDFLGGVGEAEAVAISFFADGPSPADIENVAEKSLLGQVILINYRAAGSADFTHSYIYEAVFSPPVLVSADGGRKSLLNNYIFAEGDFKRTIKGREFAICGIYYCQQNGQTQVCAHACLRMALNSIGVCNPPITGQAINNLLGLQPPFAGLQLGHISDVIENTTGVRPLISDCSGLTSAQYLSILASIIESGDVALLVFGTGTAVDHVVTVFGHTRNTDEWHPQAVPAYAGPTSAPYYPSSAWIDHFLIHDDNFGPYYALSSRALETDPNVQPHWVIALNAALPNARTDYVEAVSAIILNAVLNQTASLGTGRWFEYITQSTWQYVLRTVLIEKGRYLDHLANSRDHDNNVMATDEVSKIAINPGRIWMIEFGLPSLYTGNRSKLGEILLDAETQIDPNNFANSVIAIRLPSLLILNNSNGIETHRVGIESHTPIYLHKPHDHEW